MPKPPTDVLPAQRTAVVLHPEIRGAATAGASDSRLAEATGLAAAIDLVVAHAEIVSIGRVRPATLFGTGKVDDIKSVIKGLKPDVVVIDGTLSPVQQRNLERAWDCKVIDRTGLILEIFGARARTREGMLQVELASLSYQRSRLVRSWTHLERQRGGFGFLGGPGESQLEMDRRIITDRITKLKRLLEQVRRTRLLQRQARRRDALPVAALVGYTNAGKSTLFNRLAKADVFADAILFATLDTTLRGFSLPDGQQLILSDTVGFISDLPTDLIAAFRATLEELAEADIILIVSDIADPEHNAQRAAVHEILVDLGVDDEADGGRIIEVLNKIDLLDGTAREEVLAARNGQRVPVSAATGEGCDRLLEEIQNRLATQRVVAELTVPLTDGARIAWLYRRGEVLYRRDDDEVAHMRVRLQPADAARFDAGQGS